MVYGLGRVSHSLTDSREVIDTGEIVTVWLTRIRERLPNLTMADRDYARQRIENIDRISRAFFKKLGPRFAWLSDEWYFLADLPIPGASHYEEFPQLEDGIGTVRLFLEDARKIERILPERAQVPVSATLVTSELPANIIQSWAARLNQIEGVEVNVCVVKNEFFGG